MKQVFKLFLLLYVTSSFSQEQNYEIYNTSINSNYAELGITYLGNNSVLFSSSKKNKNDESFVIDSNRGKKVAIELYKGIITQDGDIIQSENFINESENKFYISDIAFTSDFKTVYFTWNNFHNTPSRKDSAYWQTLHLAKATIDQNLKLSNIKILPFNNDKYSNSNPNLSKDNKQLFFVSNMPNGYGENDIYVVDILGENSYSKPKNLGPNVNTTKSELYPFVDGNNTLYFSSDGHNGRRDIDILKSIYKNNSYQKAENLPSPINTKYDDFELVINDVNNSGFFSSSRKGGKGDADIYGFKLKQCSKDITGIISNIENKNSIDKALISLFHNNILQETKTINKGSKYSFKLICNEKYKIVAEKENYTSIEFEIVPDDSMNNEILKNLELTPIKCTQLISGTILDKETNSHLENVTVSLFQNNVLKETQKVNGEFNFEVTCNENYKIITKKENYSTSEIIVKTNDIRNLITAKTLTLTPIKCTQLITGTVLDNETNNSLENTTISIYQNNVLKETQKVNGEFNFEVTCNENYKIIAEKENYTTSEIIVKINGTHNLKTAKTLTLTPIKCTQLISGTILDKETNSRLENVTISLFQNNVLIENREVYGEFNFKVACNENYKIVAEKENYTTSEIIVETNNTRNLKTTKTLTLTPIKCTQLITGTILDKETTSRLENVTVSLFQNNVLKENREVYGEFNFEVACNENYKIIAEKENYVSAEIIVKTNESRDFKTSKTLTLTPIKCTQLISGTILDKETNSRLENVTVSLFQNNVLIENREVYGEFNFKVACNENYKIVAEKENYSTSEIVVETNDTRNIKTAKTLTLTPVKCTQLISGTILGKETNSRLENVTVSLFQNNVLIENREVYGEFNFEVACNENYKIIAKKENYSTTEIIVETNNTRNLKTTKTLTLTPIKCTQLITGTVLDIETNKPLTEAIVKVYKGNHLLNTLNLDTSATFNYEINCNTKYSVEVTSKNYLQDVFLIQTPSLSNQTITKTFLLEKNIEFITVGEKKMIETKSIDFDIDQSKITLKTAIKLEKVIYILKKYPTIEVEIKSHTDSRGPDAYSLKLTNNRAQSIIDHIISNGISPERISGRGYGESELLNNCSNGVKCSQAEHELNRRTEFIIIKE